MKERSVELDIAKGIGILCVILGHINIGSLAIVIYAFHLPLFFMITGSCYKYIPNQMEFIRRKTKGYLIPYVTFAVFLVAVQVITATGDKRMALIHGLTGMILQRRYTVLWFLATLYIGIIIFDRVCRLMKNSPQYIILSSAVLSIVGIMYIKIGGSVLPWNIETAFSIQLFFAIGYIVNRFDILKNLKRIKMNTLLLITILAGMGGGAF